MKVRPLAVVGFRKLWRVILVVGPLEELSFTAYPPSLYSCLVVLCRSHHVTHSQDVSSLLLFFVDQYCLSKHWNAEGHRNR